MMRPKFVLPSFRLSYSHGSEDSEDLEISKECKKGSANLNDIKDAFCFLGPGAHSLRSLSLFFSLSFFIFPLRISLASGRKLYFASSRRSSSLSRLSDERRMRNNLRRTIHMDAPRCARLDSDSSALKSNREETCSLARFDRLETGCIKITEA